MKYSKVYLLTSTSTECLWSRSQNQRFQQDGITASLRAEQTFSSSILIVPRPASTLKTRIWEGKEKGGGKERRESRKQDFTFCFQIRICFCWDLGSVPVPLSFLIILTSKSQGDSTPYCSNLKQEECVKHNLKNPNPLVTPKSTIMLYWAL